MSRAEAQPRRALLAGADDALAGLVAEWLAPLGFEVAQEAPGPFDLVVVDLPAPREGATVSLEALGREYPRTPVIALSASFFPGVENSGGLARRLGVAAALAKPVTRDALLDAVGRALETPA